MLDIIWIHIKAAYLQMFLVCNRPPSFSLRVSGFYQCGRTRRSIACTKQTYTYCTYCTHLVTQLLIHSRDRRHRVIASTRTEQPHTSCRISAEPLHLASALVSCVVIVPLFTTARCLLVVFSEERRTSQRHEVTFLP